MQLVREIIVIMITEIITVTTWKDTQNTMNMINCRKIIKGYIIINSTDTKFLKETSLIPIHFYGKKSYNKSFLNLQLIFKKNEQIGVVKLEIIPKFQILK